jgi:YVTN family beta-propeller protein
MSFYRSGFARSAKGFLALLLLAFGTDRSAGQVISATIPTSSIAWAVAVNSVTNKIYVVNYAASGRVTVIDGVTNAKTVVPVGSYPEGIDINMETNKVYVANSASNTVTVIDGATNATSSIAVGVTPTQVIVNPTNNTVYVLNASLFGTISIIDGSTNSVTDNVFAGYDPSFIAVDTATNRLFAVAGLNNNYPAQTTPSVYGFNGDTGSVVSGGIDEFVAYVTGTYPFWIAADPATDQLFVSNFGGQGFEIIGFADGAVTSTHLYSYGYGPIAFNTVTGTAYAGDGGVFSLHEINCSTYSDYSIYAGPEVGAIAVDELTNAVYVTNVVEDGTVTAVDGVTGETTTLPVGPHPTAIAVNPVTHKVYALSYDSQGTVTVIDGIPPTVPPAFLGPPKSVNVAAGSTAVFNAFATGRPGPTYQWLLDGAPLSDGGGVAGSKCPTLVLGGAASSEAGSYTCVATNGSGSATSQAARLSVATGAGPSRIVNLSTRARLDSNLGIDGPQVLIAGFVIGGPASEPLILRGVGPTLASFGIAGPIALPVLALLDSASPANLITQDAGWQNTPSAPATPWTGLVSPAAATAADFLQVGAFALPAGSADSAVDVSLPAGAYTAQITAADSSAGVVLAEVYEDPPGGSGSHLDNISSRASVGNGEEAMIAGFAISGSASLTVLIRASGPALKPFGVDGALLYPNVLLYDSAGNLVASNTAWGGNPQVAAVAARVGAFPWTDPRSSDSAVLVTLPPGSYTAEINPTVFPGGNALIEVYAVP